MESYQASVLIGEPRQHLAGLIVEHRQRFVPGEPLLVVGDILRVGDDRGGRLQRQFER